MSGQKNPDRRAPKPPSTSRPRAGRLAEFDEVEIRIEKLVTGGDGFGRFEGIPIFVPRSAPGDRLRARLVERKPDYGRAEVVEILESGPGRREPPCPHFALCGGCDLQHLEDPWQVRLKVDAVRETLDRLGGIRVEEEIEVVTGDPWGYRMRTQLQTRPADDPEDPSGVPRVGYHQRGSHELVPVDRCPVLVPELEELLPSLPTALVAKRPGRLDLAAGDAGAVTVAPVVEGLPHGEISIAAAGWVYRFDSRTFFQGHRSLIEPLIERVIGPAGEDPGGAQAFDLYAGVGLFTLPLSARYERVLAVEGDRLASRYCRNNLRTNRVRNAEVETRAIESWIARRSEDLGRAGRVVVDPPRGGLTRGVRNALRASPPGRLTYVSCQPATLARDLKFLAPALSLERLCLIDLFPQTGHMEVVAQLART